MARQQTGTTIDNRRRGSGRSASHGGIRKKYRITIIAKTLETYEIEAASEDEAEAYWAEGRLVATDDNIENDILGVEEV